MKRKFSKSGGFNQPGRADVHIDRALTQISIAFIQSEDAYVAHRIFPEIPVDKQSDKYFTLPRGAFFRDEAKKRAPGTKVEMWNWQVSTDSYLAEQWALGAQVADEIAANYDAPLDPFREASVGLMQQMMIRRERQWASEFFTTGVWTLDQTGVAAAPGANQFLQWNDAASDPIGVMRAARRRVHQRTGFKPNKLVLGKEVYDTLLDHPDLVARLDRGQTSGPALVQKDALAALFELDEILVAEAVYNSAAEGAADSFGYAMGSKSALLAYVPQRPGLMTPSAGYTFGWRGLLGGGGSVAVRRIRQEEEMAWKVESFMAFDLKRVSADLGQFFATAVA